MLTSEAVLLVLQAGAMGRGGEVFVLDMGKSVLILDLAKELIRFHGYEPDQDMAIVFTGVRPGEKLYEELLTAEEGTDTTTHEKIFIARMNSVLNKKEQGFALERLYRVAENPSKTEIVAALQVLVPTYCSESSEP